MQKLLNFILRTYMYTCVLIKFKIKPHSQGLVEMIENILCFSIIRAFNTWSQSNMSIVLSYHRRRNKK
jgi:hypothetical protein